MKTLLILFLISTIICYNNSIEDITDIIKCILKSDLIKTAFEKIKEAFKSKDISEIINTGIYLFNEFKKEISKCSKKDLRKLSNEINAIEDVTLGYPRAVYVVATQIGEDAFTWFEQGGMQFLKEQCHKYHGRITWFCQYLASPD